ncbi:21019_t:CDS:1, partial [Gigaspora rosea]
MVPKTHLLSPSGNRFSFTSSKSISSTFSKTIVELNNVNSSNTVLEPVHSRNHLSENLDRISNALTSYYSIRESLIASSQNNSFINSNSNQINNQRPSSQLSGHGSSINEHLNNSNLSLPQQKSQRS